MSSLTTVVQDACEQNNHGVALLQIGQISEARTKFQESLDAMKIATEAMPCASHKLWRSIADQKMSCVRESPVALSQLQSSSVFVFNHALLLEVVHAESDQDLDGIVRLGCIVVLTNFAMMFHVDGKRSGRDDALRTASKLYEVSLALLAKLECHSNVEISLQLLVSNNRADVHYDLCEYKESSICFGEVSTLLARNMSLFRTRLGEKEVQSLVLNTWFITQPAVARAA